MTGQKDDYYLPPFSLKAIIAEYCANEQAAALALIPSVEAERLGVCPLADLLAAAKCVEIILPDTETQRREWKVSDIMEQPQASQAPLRRDTERGPRPSKPERCVYVARSDRMKEAKNSRPSARLSEYSSSYSSLSVSQRPGRLLAARRVPDRMDRSSPVVISDPLGKSHRHRQDQLSASLKMRGPMLPQRGSGGVPPGRSYASHVAQPSVSSAAPASRQVYPPWKTLGYPVRTSMSPERYPSKLISASVAAPTAMVSSAASRASSPAQSMVPHLAVHGAPSPPGAPVAPVTSMASLGAPVAVPRTFSRQASMDRSQQWVRMNAVNRERSDLGTFTSPVMVRDQRGVICQAWAPVAQSPHRIVGYGTYRPAMAPMSAPMRAFPVRQCQGPVIYGARQVASPQGGYPIG